MRLITKLNGKVLNGFPSIHYSQKLFAWSRLSKIYPLPPSPVSIPTTLPYTPIFQVVQRILFFSEHTMPLNTISLFAWCSVIFLPHFFKLLSDSFFKIQLDYDIPNSPKSLSFELLVNTLLWRMFIKISFHQLFGIELHSLLSC